MRHALIALLVTGCSQVFDLEAGKLSDASTTDHDASPPDSRPLPMEDAELGECERMHDEDSDGMPDFADPCPWVPGEGLPDGDADGISDLCDPSPSSNQRIVFTEGFECTLDEWTGDGGWQLTQGGLAHEGAELQRLRRPLAADRPTYVFTRIHVGPTPGEHQRIALRSAGSDVAGCQIEDEKSDSAHGPTSVTGDAVVCMPGCRGGSPKPLMLTDGSISVSLQHRPRTGTAGPLLRCNFGDKQLLSDVIGTESSLVSLEIEAATPVTYDYIVVMQDE